MNQHHLWEIFKFSVNAGIGCLALMYLGSIRHQLRVLRWNR